MSHPLKVSVRVNKMVFPNVVVIVFTSDQVGDIVLCLRAGDTLETPDINDTAYLTQWGDSGNFPKVSDSQGSPSTLAELSADGMYEYADFGRKMIAAAIASNSPV